MISTRSKFSASRLHTGHEELNPASRASTRIRSQRLLPQPRARRVRPPSTRNDTTRHHRETLLFSSRRARFPDIKFILSHRAAPHPIGAAASRFWPISARIEIPPAGRPIHYLQRFYYDTANALDGLSAGLADEAHQADPAGFGTDFPVPHGERTAAELRETGCSGTADGAPSNAQRRP